MKSLGELKAGIWVNLIKIGKVPHVYIPACSDSVWLPTNELSAHVREGKNPGLIATGQVHAHFAFGQGETEVCWPSGLVQ